MNSHKNARTTCEGRKLLIERIIVAMGLKPAAFAAGISMRTARKWHMIFKQSALADSNQGKRRTFCHPSTTCKSRKPVQIDGDTSGTHERKSRLHGLLR
jgi:hypothetical protein